VVFPLRDDVVLLSAVKIAAEPKTLTTGLEGRSHRKLTKLRSGLTVCTVAAATTFEEMQKVVNKSVSEIGLMEFMRLDHGGILAKAGVDGDPKSVRVIMGNPLIMQSMARLVPDAGSYAPVTVLIDQRQDGVHLSYDEMASFLAPYGNADALKIARDLEAKVKRLLEGASEREYG
jgi:uncharacterized protein (DUF302 family)